VNSRGPGRSVEDRERSFFDELYAEEAVHPLGNELRLRRELESLLRARGGRPLERVLTIGCGEGSFERMLSPHAGQIVAVDIAAPGIELAKKQARAAGVVNVDFRCMPLSEIDWNEQFDAILCIAFLHHVPEPDLPEFLAQAFAHTKPGGLFYSQDPNVHGVMRKLGRLLLRDGYDDYHSADERELDPAQTAAALRAAGFDDVQQGFIDLTLIPLQYYAPEAPNGLMHLARAVDRLWCATPLRPWSSGFTLCATRAG
jgi:2-polyprenyl-3-methyl-5-hydroxy-6-metoxy-1,4-benzoquinol methylase